MLWRRFLAAGTIEEKIYQRQLSKEGLQTIVVDEQQEKAKISSEMLRWVLLRRPLACGRRLCLPRV